MRKYLFLLVLVLSFNINAQNRESVKMINDTLHVTFKFNESVLSPKNENLMDSIFSIANSIIVTIDNAVINEKHSKKLSEDRLKYIELFLNNNGLLSTDVSKKHKKLYYNRYRRFRRWPRL